MSEAQIFQLVLTLAGILISFLLTVIVMYVLLPWLRSKKLNQPIGEFAPETHLTKSQTPTLGGLSFVVASAITMVGLAIFLYATGRGAGLPPVLATYGYAFFNALIGITDDYSKLVKKQNLGLRAWQKFLLQLIVAGAYLVLLIRFGTFDTRIAFPFTNFVLDIGVFSYPLALLLMTGIVNSTNLTDGVDGLLSSTAIIVSGFLAAYALSRWDAMAAIVPALILGGAFGFFLYNAHPAKVFMGDTGSLFIGAALVGTAFLLNEPLIILIAGGIYVIETASVILQVISVRLINLGLRKTRFFKRTPIHHHFELSGFGEWQIVYLFCIVTLVFCTVAWLSFL